MNIPTIFKSFQSPKYTSILKYAAVALIAILIFSAGVSVGNRGARFADQWDKNYARQFGGPQSPFSMPDRGDRPNMPHGAFGAVVGVSFPSFAIKGPREAEKIVLIGSTTMIRSLRSSASVDDIRIGSSVVVIGEPDDMGRINANLIRIVPSPEIQ